MIFAGSTAGICASWSSFRPIPRFHPLPNPSPPGVGVSGTPSPLVDSVGKGGDWLSGRGLAVPNPCLGQASRLRSQELDGRSHQSPHPYPPACGLCWERGDWLSGRGLAVPNPCLGQASRLRSQDRTGWTFPSESTRTLLGKGGIGYQVGVWRCQTPTWDRVSHQSPLCLRVSVVKRNEPSEPGILPKIPQNFCATGALLTVSPPRFCWLPKDKKKKTKRQKDTRTHVQENKRASRTPAPSLT